jgi:hypothetical protein
MATDFGKFLRRHSNGYDATKELACDRFAWSLFMTEAKIRREGANIVIEMQNAVDAEAVIDEMDAAIAEKERRANFIGKAVSKALKGESDTQD